MKRILAIMAVMVFSMSLPSCKSKVKDADLQAAVQSALLSNPELSNLSSSVDQGVATITGEVKDQATQASVEPALKDIKGLKEVINNTTVAAPVTETDSGPSITPDDPLSVAVRDAIKDHPTVQAEVRDGVVTLSGEISKANEKVLIQKINATRPKKIDRTALVTR